MANRTRITSVSARRRLLAATPPYIAFRSSLDEKMEEFPDRADAWTDAPCHREVPIAEMCFTISPA